MHIISTKKIFELLIFFCLLITACGVISPSDTQLYEITDGDPERGRDLFQKTVIGTPSSPGCITCHSLEEGVTIVGPSLRELSTRANNRIPELSGAEYLRQSITQPDNYVVDGFPSGVMYQDYKNSLSPQEVNDLVAFLMTQR